MSDASGVNLFGFYTDNMKTENTLKRLEKYLVPVILITVGAFMYVISYEYDYEVALFPRYLSLFTIISGLLIIIGGIAKEKNLLDDMPYEIGDGSKVHGEGIQPEKSNEDKQMGEMMDIEAEKNQDVESINKLQEIIPQANDKIISTALISLYAMASYLIGMLWATPLFVISYGHLYNLKKFEIILLAVVSFIAGYLFMIAIHLPIDTGVIHDQIGL